MELRKILVGIEGLKAKGSLDLEISSVECDYREVKQGSVFVAIKGYEVDGHTFINKAIEKGARAIIFEEGTNYKEFAATAKNVTLIMAPNTRLALAKCSCNFYDHPSKKMKVIGITGTKGKTTTSFMLKSILEKQGKKVGLIGTIAVYIGDKLVKNSDRTTPESNKLQQILAKMYELGIEVVIMEVSSQSLKLDRVAGTEFYAGIFTNLSEDHISKNEHKDMQEYFEAKMKLFDMCKYPFVNADSIYTSKILEAMPSQEVQTFGIDNYCNLLAKDITVTNTYVDFRAKVKDRNERIKVSIPGRFSVYNSLAAISVARLLGASVEQMKEALENIKVPGRSELVDNKQELKIMIDYAHTPESLKSILETVKTYTIGRIICVFGCGGDRDKNKRPLMGEIAGKLAEHTIITSDNPRTEDPEEIIKEIEEGIKKTKGKYECITDRREAIKKAISMANTKDIIILAGKGHETYQEIGKEKNPFDERVIIKEILEELEKEPKKKKKK